jgi:beta-N-acetylhexosaminidase
LASIVVATVALAACGGKSAAPNATTGAGTVFTVPETLPQRTVTGGPEKATPATTPTTAAESEPAPRPAGPPKPPIVQDLIPFPQQRMAEMAAYAQRHYGLDSYVLDQPKVIVEHVAVAPSAAAVKATFSNNVADVELHELPQVCSHFVVDADGTIHQLVSLHVMCRHTVGLNYTAIGIEHAGNTDADVLGNAAELAASIKLTTWLRCRYGIALKNVIGHNESLSSPYHHENVAALRTQTHGDMQHASMEVYRAELAKHPCAG